MSLFKEQLNERNNTDQRLLENSFDEIAGVVLGSRPIIRNEDKRDVAKNAIDEILQFFELRPLDIPESFVGISDLTEYYQQAYGMMYREVELKDSWYLDAFGPILAFTKDNQTPVALIPGHFGGYSFNDPVTKKRLRVTRRSAARFETAALSFCRPFPQKEIEPIELIRFIRKSVPLGERLLLNASQLLVLAIGLILPYLVKLLTGPVAGSGSAEPLIGVSVCMICILVSMHLFSVVKGLLAGRQMQKTLTAVRTAVMTRLLSLPVGFFQRFGAGEMKTRADAVVSFAEQYLNVTTTMGLTLITSLLYFFVIYRQARALLPAAVAYVLVMLLLSLIMIRMERKFYERSMEIQAEEAGFSYSLITGVRKIRLVGAEKRMFARWMKLYSEKAGLVYRPPLLIKISSAVTLGIGLLSMILVYRLALKHEVDAPSFFAFSAAYGSIVSMVTAAFGVTFTAYQIRPLLKIAEPILKTAPEETKDKEIITKLTGRIDLDRVSFRYDKDAPYIFQNVSLRINPKEYVAVVGKSGCGKSTLMRLILGFEKPETGAVFFDGKNLRNLNLSCLHKMIGTVLQNNDLFPGDIYSNIAAMKPGLSVEEAWDAAEKAGIADDIREMPMGMRTFVSEGRGTLSGGQKQRILIARVIAAKPKVLVFDEATSALDNIAQKKVSDALDAMRCTRIVIAHRISTVRHCDRIIAIDGGRIVEEGSFDELIAKNGFFADLVKRQMVE